MQTKIPSNQTLICDAGARSDIILIPLMIAAIAAASVIYHQNTLAPHGPAMVGCDQESFRQISNRPTILYDTRHYVLQWTIFGIGTILIALFTLMAERARKSWDEENQTRKFRVVAMITIGLCCTIIFAILLSNKLQVLSPGFFLACKPVKWDCSGKDGTTSQEMFCSTSSSQWMPARTAFPHCFCTVLAYLTVCWYFWAEDRYPKRVPHWVRTIAVVPLLLCGFVAVAQAEAEFWGIMMSYGAGALIAIATIKILFPLFDWKMPEIMRNEEPV